MAILKLKDVRGQKVFELSRIRDHWVDYDVGVFQ